VQLGYALTYPAAGIVETFGAGWDWLWLDNQHGELDIPTMRECVRVADSLGVPTVIRTAGKDPWQIAPALDTGAWGVMVPMVESAEEARRFAVEARFAPAGKRSYAGRRLTDVYGSSYLEQSRAQTLVVVQIESRDGLESCEAIAGVEGVDALFFGHADMKLSLGLPLETPIDDVRVAAAFRRMADAARSAGKAAGCVMVAEKDLQLALGLGCTLVAAAVDQTSLQRDATRALETARRLAGR
jgi:4-hydroxy-2-oxoheptanedioate aldolase